MAEEGMANRYARYTDYEYLSQQGLREEFKMALGLDVIWKQIQDYRLGHRKDLPLRALGSNSYLHFTFTQALKDRLYNPFSSLFDSFRQRVRDIDRDRNLRSDFLYSLNKLIVLGAEKLEGADCGESSINAILGGYYHEEDPKKSLIFRYFGILGDFEELVESTRADDTKNSVEQFLGAAMERLYGTEDLEMFYRIDNPHKIYVTDAAPKFASFETISQRMDALWEYWEDNSDPVWLVAFITAYYAIYVNPFDMEGGKNHNALLGVLLARYAIYESGYSSLATILPLEKILDFPGHFSRYEDIEIRKEGDLTYFIKQAIETLTPVIENLLNGVQIQHKTEIEREFVEIPPEEMETIRKEAETPIIEDWEDVVPELKPQAKPEAKVEEKPRQKREETPDASSFVAPPDAGEAALVPPKEIVGEKQSAANKERAKYVLETHPMLRKVQANFYATHCTLGRFYTIQDFKKATKCAYETARTSMELLASEGLYEKRHIKNKFVYTPIRQGGK